VPLAKSAPEAWGGINSEWFPMKNPPPGRGGIPAEAGSGDSRVREDQPIAGAIRATGVASAAARSSGKL
jgi:hypothetical protein